MVKNGNSSDIIQIDYTSLEVCTFTEFWQSKLPEDEKTRTQVQMQHRFDTYIWLWVTEGVCEHWLDFQAVNQQLDEWILIRPQQVHRFLTMENWDGWAVSFPAAMLPPHLAKAWQALPQTQKITPKQTALLRPALTLLKSYRYLDLPNVDALAQTQLHSFIQLLLTLFTPQNDTPNRQSQRWQAFNALLEAHFRQQHQVQFYAEQLGCSDKTLANLCHTHAGNTPKALIEQRILLEAKRLLLHSNQAIKQIALYLGFEEPTHFNKFFKKLANETPKVFRESCLARVEKCEKLPVNA